MQASRLKLVGGVLAVVVAVTGCANMSPVQQGTTAGAGVGAGLGGLIGAATGGGGGGRTAKGAVIGGVLGAVAGNIWSSRMEEQKRAMEQATRGTGVEVSQTADNRLKLAIPSDISFDTGKADIKPNFRPILDQFATTLASNPATFVTIIGHTDNTGTDAINDPLSLQRASRARDYLTVRGIAPARFTVAGHGSHEPVAVNNSAANRAKNRRVEIFVAEPQN